MYAYILYTYIIYRYTYTHIPIHIHLYICWTMFCIINLQGHSSLSQFIILDLNVDKDVSCF